MQARLPVLAPAPIAVLSRVPPWGVAPLLVPYVHDLPDSAPTRGDCAVHPMGGLDHRTDHWFDQNVTGAGGRLAGWARRC